MARMYSADELLSMRGKTAVAIVDLKNLNPSNASDIIKTSRDDHSTQKHHRPSLKDYDHISRDKTFSRSDTTHSHSNAARSHSDTLQLPGVSEEEDDQVVYRGHPGQTLAKQWRLQKRGSSDSSSQPYSAPSGFEAQKADNFKKFYEAVVSPTHVRVTAGGRIVPNTQATTRSTFIWNRDQKLFEPTKQAPIETVEQQGHWLQGVSLNPYDLRSPNTATGLRFDNTYGHPLGLQLLSPSMTPSPYQYVDSATAGAKPSTVDEDPTAEENSSVTNGEITISPPSQFDVSRPFMHNGQLVYPMPPGFQVPPNMPVLPFSMLGNTNAHQPQFGPSSGIMLSGPLQFQPGNLSYPQPMSFIGQPGPYISTTRHTPFMTSGQLHSMSQSSGAISNGPPTLLPGQPITMLPPPVMLGHQVQALQQQLKQIDHQLQNNRHQIDEQHAINQQIYLQNQILALQSTMHSTPIQQVNLTTYDQSGLSSWNAGLGVTGVPFGPATEVVNGLSTASLEAENAVSARDQNSAYGIAAADQEKRDIDTETNVTPTSETLDTGSSMDSEPNSRKRLRAAAAKALPFQPRSQRTIASESILFDNKSPTIEKIVDSGELTGSEESASQIEDRLLSNAGSWMAPSQSSSAMVIRSLPASSRASTVGFRTKGRASNDSSSSISRVKSFPVPTTAGGRGIAASQGPKISVPYLLGLLPSGMSLDRAESHDLVYSRELTEEELRARHLYWGRAPREISKGLPKFDGRDFYPPSPVKNFAIPTTRNVDPKYYPDYQTSTPSTYMQSKFSKSAHSLHNSTSRRGSGNYSHPFNNTTTADFSNAETATDNEKSTTEDDIASVNSWGVSSAMERELFSPPAGLISSFKEESDFGSAGIMGFKHPMIRNPNVTSTQSSFLQGMLKSTPRTSMAAATDALSSATARGYLPQYGGAAIASLTPSMGNFTASAQTSNNAEGPGRRGSASSTQNENRPLSRRSPPGDALTAVDSLRKMNGQNKTVTDPGFDSNTTGIGPVYGRSEW